MGRQRLRPSALALALVQEEGAVEALVRALEVAYLPQVYFFRYRRVPFALRRPRSALAVAWEQAQAVGVGEAAQAEAVSLPVLRRMR